MSSWIIVVDDDVTNLKMAGQILSESNMRVTAVRSGRALLDYVRDKGAPDLVLLDIKMPEMDGFETYDRFRELEEELGIAATPVVMLTADEDKASESRGFEMGVSDYIRKPFDPDVLVRRVENIVRTRGKMKRFEQEATIDKLTGFYNKYAANEHIEEMCLNKTGALMIMDLDSFKLVNDIYGHDMGDRVLAAFARILRENMVFPCVFGRIGGDEFLAFAQNLKDEKDIAKYSDAINAHLLSEARKMMGEDMSIPLGASIGVIFVPEQGTKFNELFRLCDRALYTIKNNGKHGYSLYLEEEAEAKIPTEISLAVLTTILEERSIPQNAMWMGKEAFGNVYRYMIRYMQRYRGTAYKMLFTAHFVPKDLSESEKGKIMTSLRELLQESLRNSDIMMQIGENHFFLMLPEISDYNVNRVTQRVMESWKNHQYSGLIDLKVETASTGAGAADSLPDTAEVGQVVVVSDKPDDLEYMYDALASRGIDTVKAAGGQELLDHLAGNICGLILLAADMKEPDGLETIIKIRKCNGVIRHIPIVLVAGDDPDIERRALELGVTDFVSLPISREKLYIRIKNLLRLTSYDRHSEREAERKMSEE